jgi:hypothetical protein
LSPLARPWSLWWKTNGRAFFLRRPIKMIANYTDYGWCWGIYGFF